LKERKPNEAKNAHKKKWVENTFVPGNLKPANNLDLKNNQRDPKTKEREIPGRVLLLNRPQSSKPNGQKQKKKKKIYSIKKTKRKEGATRGGGGEDPGTRQPTALGGRRRGPSG